MIWVKTSDVLKQSSLPFPDQLYLISLTFDRAALLGDLPSCWVPFPIQDVVLLARSRLSVEEINNPLRFLPPIRDRRPEEGWSSYVSSVRPRGWSWIEVLAANGPMSLASVTQVIQSCYQSEAHFARPAMRDLQIVSFDKRSEASGFPSLSGLLSCDGANPPVLGPGNLCPRQKLAQIKLDLHRQSSVRTLDLGSLRFPQHLVVVQAICLRLLSIQRSWKSVISGILCFSEYMMIMHPYDSHFPTSKYHLLGFCSIFKNSGTLSQYLSHVKLTASLTSSDWPDTHHLVSSVVKGLRKITVRHQAQILSRKQIRSIIYALIARGRVDLCRFIVVAYHYMFRVQSELYPLQLDGSTHHRIWHSKISLRSKQVEICLSRRKNHPHGSKLVRTCSCIKYKDLLCGVCSIKAHLKNRVNPTDRVFGSVSLCDIDIIRSVCQPLDISGVSWHTFRRSAAQHMLISGGTISRIIKAGGWKSSAFLRYLHRKDVDDRAALEIVQNESDVEGEDL